MADRPPTRPEVPTSLLLFWAASTKGTGGSVDTESGEDLALEGAQPDHDLTFIALRVTEADNADPLELTKRPACREVLVSEVRVGELSSPEVEGHHSFQDGGEHADGDMSPHALLGVVEDRVQR